MRACRSSGKPFFTIFCYDSVILHDYNKVILWVENKRKMNSIKKLLFSALVMLPLAAAAQYYPFNNRNLSEQQRLQDLLNRLTVEEKVSLLRHNQPAISRLGLPKYYFGNEALHGVCRPGRFTVFPQAIGLAGMWNIPLMHRVATAISDEARGRWTELGWGAWQYDSASDLLSFFSPTVNMARDPRWGRTPETYGEDPYLTSQTAVAFVTGLQGDDPDYVKVVSTVKHFVANNIEENRSGISSQVSERDLREYYFVPYENAVKKANVQSVMSAYNALNGVPCSANQWLLTDVLRGDWGFDGYVVSDCSALSYDYEHHHFVGSYEESAQYSMRAGLDLECGDGVYAGPLLNAYNRGWVTAAQLDSAVYRVMRARLRLGLLDRVNNSPYNNIQPSVVGCAEHQELAAEAARQSIVLMQNDGTLPLDMSQISSIAVVGPNAARHEYGEYSGVPLNEPVSVLEGLINATQGTGIELNHAPWVGNNSSYALVNSDHFDGGIKMEYYSNANLQGEPFATTQTDFVYFDPANQPPNPMVPSAPMSIRWSGDFVAPATGRYLFSITSDDGCRLKVDDRTLVDDWTVHSQQTAYASIGLHEGQSYHIVFEYFDNGGDAVATLRWRMPSTVTTDPLDAYGNAGKMIRQSDLTIAVMGINQNYEREGHDRSVIELPEEQEEFLKLAYEANPNLIVVMVAGSPLTSRWVKENVPAMLYAWYPGEQGGTAVADVLMGDYNPAGRLPLTFYNSTAELPAFDDYDITNGRTYQYYRNEPLYVFGHGLSYTSFRYSGLRVSVNEGVMNVQFDVRNVGRADGDEVPQVYVRFPQLARPLPIKQLHAFDRVTVPRATTVHMNFDIPLSELRLWDDDLKEFYTPEGQYAVMVGASSADIRLQQMVQVGQGSPIVTGIDEVEIDGFGYRVLDQAVELTALAGPINARIYTSDGRMTNLLTGVEGTRHIDLGRGFYLIEVEKGTDRRTYKVLVK